MSDFRNFNINGVDVSINASGVVYDDSSTLFDADNIQTALEKINDIINSQDSELYKITNSYNILPEPTSSQSYVDENGHEQSNSAWYTTDYIEVEEGDIYVLTTRFTNNTTPIAAYSVDVNTDSKIYNKVKSLVIAELSSSIYTTKYLRIRKGVEYIRICWDNEAAPAYTKTILYKMPFQAVVACGGNSALFSYGDFINTYGVSGNTTAGASTLWFYTPQYIPISNIDSFKIFLMKGANGISYYDKEYNYISGVTTSTNPSSSSDLVWITEDILTDAPSDAVFARFAMTTFAGDSIGNFYTYLKTYGTNFEASPMEYMVDKVDNLSTTLTGQINNINTSDNAGLFYFDNIICIGDSLTYGDFGSYPEGTANMHEPYNYPYYFAKMTNSTVKNAGRNGWTPQTMYSSRETVIGTDGGYDCIYIYLGTNGGLTDTIDTDASGDDYTTYTTTTNTGAYCALIGWLQETYSTANIFLINFHYGRRGTSWSETNSDILDKIASKFSLHVIDIMNNSPFTSDVDNARLYRPVGIDEEIEATGSSSGNLHFGRLGYYELSKCIMKLTNQIIEDNPSEFALNV